MCDSITNGDPISIATTGGGGGGGGECCAPANVIIASNVLNTTGNVIAGNVIAGDGTFTGNLYVYGSIIGNLSFQTLNAVTINTGSIVSGAYYGNASGLSNLNASNIKGSANLTNLYVQNSVTTTNLFFQNSILSTNLPVFNTAQGTWGSSSNVSRVTVDQYGRVSGASNVAITSSQWTTIDANIAYANGVSIGILSNPPTGSNLYVVGTTNVTSLNVSDTLYVNGAFTSNATNTSFLFDTLTIPYLNTLNIQAQGTSNMNVIFANAYYGNGAGLSNINASNLAFGVINSALVYGNTLSNIQVSNIAGFVTGNALSNLNASNLAFGVVNSALIYGNTLSNLNFSNITGFLSNTLSNLNASNIAFGVIDSARIYGNTLSNINSSNLVGNVAYANVALVVSQASQPNITSVGTLTSLNVSGTSNTSALVVPGSLTANATNTTFFFDTLVIPYLNVTTSANIASLVVPTANIGTLNVLTISNLNSLTTNLTASTANIGTLNVISISNLNSLTTNLIASTANVGTLNIVSISNLNSLTLSNLTVTSNIIPTTGGNTYVQGNLVVAGNVFSSLGVPLGEGGGYYLSLPTDIALQPPYTGAVYGTTYPLSVGLSNGWNITGTSTMITITTNGNFKFNKAGPYMLSAVFQGSTDNITGLAVGSNVADVHGTDQGYLYRYTTFVTQNPSELIKIPISVTDITKYYYLDIWCVDGGALKATTTGTGGTYMTITPLTGGGLATGGPGGTPPSQWINSGSNIYFSNFVGIGAINPQYNLDVSGDLRVTGNIYGNVVGTTIFSVVKGLTSNYVATASDYYIGVNGAAKVTLPLGSSVPVGKSYVVKDESGNASVTSVLLQASGSDVIDGYSNVTMALDNISLTTIWTGSRWSLI